MSFEMKRPDFSLLTLYFALLLPRSVNYHITHVALASAPVATGKPRVTRVTKEQVLLKC